MTTIAYRDGVLASDSRITSNDAIEGATPKIIKVGPFLVGAAGRAAECEKFRDWVRKGAHNEPPFYGSCESNGLLVTPDGLIIVWSEHGPWRVRAPFYALGSGYQFAMGAMARGASAEEAVRIAAEFDTATGGEIVTLRH